LTIANRDWENWKATMSVGPPEPGAAAKQVTRPRPGHADLAGATKYGHRDIRNVLERSSARETTARVAVAGVAKRLLAEFGMTILSHVTELGGIRISPDLDLPWEEIRRRAEASEVRCADPAAEAEVIVAIYDAKAKGDTLGGVFEVVAPGCPGGDEATVHPADAPPVGGRRHQGSRRGGRRAERRQRGAGGRRRRRGDAGPRPRDALSREVRR